MRIGKTYHFDAAHYLPEHPKCGVMHGHTYHVTVTLYGEPNQDGFIMDFGQLDKIVKSELDELDHDVLNKHLSNPTCELLARYLKDLLLHRLEPLMPKGLAIRVQEGDGGWAEDSNSSLHSQILPKRGII